MEHKRDYLCQKTGNLFVEYRQKVMPSGLAVTTADYWAFEYEENAYILVPTERLKELARIAYRQGRLKRGGDYNNYEGVLLPVEWLVRPVKALQ